MCATSPLTCINMFDKNLAAPAAGQLTSWLLVVNCLPLLNSNFPSTLTAPTITCLMLAKFQSAMQPLNRESKPIRSSRIWCSTSLTLVNVAVTVRVHMPLLDYSQHIHVAPNTAMPHNIYSYACNRAKHVLCTKIIYFTGKQYGFLMMNKWTFYNGFKRSTFLIL